MFRHVGFFVFRSFQELCYAIMLFDQGICLYLVSGVGVSPGSVKRMCARMKAS